MTVVRWTLTDPATSATYTFPINPNQMTSPHGIWQTDTYGASPIVSLAPTGAIAAWRKNKNPTQWSFSGRFYNQVQYNTAVTWFNKDGVLTLTDHFARTWNVRLTALEVKPVRSMSPFWKFEYTFKCLVYNDQVGTL